MKVGIIGAGVMGAGIAQTFAVCNGYEVILYDETAEFAESGKNRIRKSLDKLVSREKITLEDASLILSHIRTGKDEALSDCDLIIEAATELMELKQKLFRKLHILCKPEAIFASNTSSLSITALSADAGRPVVGMHFFNPAPVMKLVEVVSGLNTPSELAEQVANTVRDIGKVPVEVRDSAGFVVNRILIPMINEAVGILAEGTASAENIDTAMKLGANHPMGPLALGDLVGLDVCLAVMQVLESETGDPKYRPHPLLRQMVRAGRLGRKTGCGFFDYNK